MLETETPRHSVTIQSVERAVLVLHVFFEEGNALSVSEVVSKTGLAPATAHRLLSTLVKTGLVEQNQKSARYALSVKMLGSAALALSSSPLVTHGRHFLQTISDATGLNSYLAVPLRQGSVMLARVQGRRSSSGVDFQVGNTLSFQTSASGKLFLAFMPEKQRREVVDRLDFKRRTANTIVEPRLLEDELTRIRDRGYATDQGERHDGFFSLAVPVRKDDGTIVAALCCGGWDSELPEDYESVILRELIPAAEEYSRAFAQLPW
jgi:DNA-binding IclR family transcriptional regulator